MINRQGGRGRKKNGNQFIFVIFTGGLKMVALDLQNLASITYADFQKIIDGEGVISSLQWFKNANIFFCLQEDVRNFIYEREA